MFSEQSKVIHHFQKQNTIDVVCYIWLETIRHVHKEVGSEVSNTRFTKGKLVQFISKWIILQQKCLWVKNQYNIMIFSILICYESYLKKKKSFIMNNCHWLLSLGNFLSFPLGGFVRWFLFGWRFKIQLLISLWKLYHWIFWLESYGIYLLQSLTFILIQSAE